MNTNETTQDTQEIKETYEAPSIVEHEALTEVTAQVRSGPPIPDMPIPM